MCSLYYDIGFVLQYKVKKSLYLLRNWYFLLQMEVLPVVHCTSQSFSVDVDF